MLTMIAETMLPEAYLKGGSVVGLSTLLGFLIAIFSKTLEPAPAGPHAGGHSQRPATEQVEPHPSARPPSPEGGGGP